MPHKLNTLQASLLERLQTMPKVMAYTKPFRDDTSRRHLTTNEVRVRIARDRRDLRMDFSGFILSSDPASGIDKANIDNWLAAMYPDNVMVMPPMWGKDNEGKAKEFESLVTAHGPTVLAISSFDGGLGSIIIHEKTRPEIQLEDYMRWHPPVMQILHVTAAEIERVLGLNEHSPLPRKKKRDA